MTTKWDELCVVLAKVECRHNCEMGGPTWSRLTAFQRGTLRRNADTALRALLAKGCVIVPGEATDAMIIAAGEAQQQSIGSWGEPKVAIAAALSAGSIKPEGE